MAALYDLNSTTIVSKLVGRGLSNEEIDRAMRQLIGNDWREIKANLWFRRLKNQGYVLQNEQELSVNDLEALINGRLKLDDLSKRKHD
jgi:SOS response regulatory protein OraA/RecX